MSVRLRTHREEMKCPHRADYRNRGFRTCSYLTENGEPYTDPEELGKSDLDAGILPRRNDAKSPSLVGTLFPKRSSRFTDMLSSAGARQATWSAADRAHKFPSLPSTTW